MAWSRASSLDRTLQCVGSAALYNNTPALKLIPKPENAIKAAEYGTLVHHWKETGKVEGSDSHVKTFNKKLGFLKTAGISRLDLWPAAGFHEVAVAYNCIDGRVAILYEGDTDAFKTGHSEPWITGSCDYYLKDDGGLLVDDLKTGMLWDKSARACAQLYFYAMNIAKVHHVQETEIRITHWPKYPLERLPEFMDDEPVIITSETFARLESRLKKDYLNYKSTNPEFRLGEACEYCPAKSLCPLQQG